MAAKKHVPAWVEALGVGDEVIEWKNSYTTPAWARVSKVERLTPTLVILSSGSRINKSSCRESGYPYDTHMEPIDSEGGQRRLDQYRFQIRLATAISKVEQLAQTIRSSKSEVLLAQVEKFLGIKP
jgi:hypothetical protein